MAKKKKSQLKPVARGFATTSIAKKAAPVEDELGGEPVAGSLEEEESRDRYEEASGIHSPPQAEADEFDLEKIEMQSLQNLVDKLQERVEKEVSRTLKVCLVVSIS
jgi:ATP-dependent RNA helicase DHX29